MKCDKCNGTGKLGIPLEEYSKWTPYPKCRKCDGTGEVAEVVTEKDSIKFNFRKSFEEALNEEYTKDKHYLDKDSEGFYCNEDVQVNFESGIMSMHRRWSQHERQRGITFDSDVTKTLLKIFEEHARFEADNELLRNEVKELEERLILEVGGISLV